MVVASMTEPLDDARGELLARELETYAQRYRGEWQTATPSLSWAQVDRIIIALRPAPVPSREKQLQILQLFKDGFLSADEVLAALSSQHQGGG